VDCRLFIRFKVVLGQLLSNFGGFHPHNGVVGRIVTDRAPKHLGANHPLSQGINLSFQSMPNDQLKKILGAPAAGECVACEHLFKLKAHQNNALWTEFIKLASWLDCCHTP
jgi:hypothetical protein